MEYLAYALVISLVLNVWLCFALRIEREHIRELQQIDSECAKRLEALAYRVSSMGTEE